MENKDKISEQTARAMLKCVPIHKLNFLINQDPENIIIEMWKEEGFIKCQ